MPFFGAVVEEGGVFVEGVVPLVLPLVAPLLVPDGAPVDAPELVAPGEVIAPPLVFIVLPPRLAVFVCHVITP